MLGAREQEVVDVLWADGPSTVADVRARLSTPLAYTTVLTILRNLEGKGVVGRWREGRAHRYFALVPQEVAREGALQRLLDRFFGGRHERLLAHLVESRKLAPRELAELCERVARDRGK